MIALLDIGGTQIKFGVFDESAQKMIALGSMDTLASQSNFNVIDRVHTIISEIKKNYSLEGVAISSAGVIDHINGVVLHANQNLPNYKGTSLKETIEKTYNIPCSVENDVNCALLGEIHFGELKNITNALMLTIGTGVGGSVFLNGEIFHGSSYSAGEVGYSFMGDENIESIASARALVGNVQVRVEEPAIDGHWVFEQAKAGNQICIEEINRFVDGLVKIIINTTSLLNPEVVILGGGIMEQTDYLKEKIMNRFNDLYQNHYVRSRMDIRFATLGNRAGMLGAYQHFKNSN